MNRRRSGIGIFGGTFNPVHRGHLAAARQVWRRSRLKKILFIPAFLPPHKSREGLAPARHRLRMLRLAVGNTPYFKVSTIELERRKKSYTIDTLRSLRGKMGRKGPFFFIIGADELSGLPRWRRIKEILKLCRFVVITRPGYTYGRKDFQGAPFIKKDLKNMVVLNAATPDISATEVRRRVQLGRPFGSLVPPGVARYIREHDLYKSASRQDKNSI